MKKGLSVLSVILVIIFGAGLFLKIKGADLIKSAVNTEGSAMLGTSVTLDDISLGLLDGTAGFSGLSIGQPEGYGDDKSFSVDQFSVKLEPMSLFEDHVKIDTILIDAPTINLVLKGADTNFEALQANVGETPEDPNATPVKMSIRDLYLNKTHLRIHSDVLGENNVTLADVHLTNIGIDENGVAPDEVLRLTLEAIKPQIAKALVELGIKNKLTKAVGQEVGNVLDKVVAPVADKLKDGIGSLLKKKPKTD